jgi:hypothetical protein
MDEYCANCGQELAADSRFCTGCGIDLSKPPSFYTPETDPPVPDHTSVSLYTPGVPPDIEKAVNDLDASIAELDKVMKLHGVEGVMEQFEKPRQVVGVFILNNSGSNSIQSQSNKIESGVGTGGFFFAGGMISTEEQGEGEEGDDRWGWLGNIFG